MPIATLTPEEWAARSEEHADELARVKSMPMPEGRGPTDRQGDYERWGLAPDGWGAKGPPDAPYGRGREGSPLVWRPGREPGIPNKATRMEKTIKEAVMEAMPKAPSPVSKRRLDPKPEAPETIFVADEDEVAAIADDPERVKRTHQIEYVRAWQVVRAAMQSKFLGLKDRATIAMDVIKTMRASKEIFVIDSANAAEVDWAKEVTSIQRGLAKYAPLASSAGNSDGDRGKN